VTAGAFLLAGFVKGVIGLGLPTVAIGLLGLMMTPAQAAAIMVAPALITNVWQAMIGKSLLPLLGRIWPMLAGICLGTFAAATWLPGANSGQATIWLGVALVVYACIGLTKMDFHVSPRGERWLSLPVGSLTGAITRDRRLRTAGNALSARAETRPAPVGADARHLVYGIDAGPRRGADACRRDRHVAGDASRGRDRGVLARHVARTTGARAGAGEDLPAVVFSRLARARRASGAARPAVMD
jgi:hypothetical protein